MAISNKNEPFYVQLLTNWPEGTLSWAQEAYTPVTIYYSYDNTLNNIQNDAALVGDEITIDSEAWLARQAMNEIEKIANVTFIENDNAQKKIVFSTLDRQGDGGYAQPDGVGTLITYANVVLDSFNENDGLFSWIHELSHAIGLTHPGGVTPENGHNNDYNHSHTVKPPKLGPVYKLGFSVSAQGLSSHVA